MPPPRRESRAAAAASVSARQTGICPLGQIEFTSYQIPKVSGGISIPIIRPNASPHFTKLYDMDVIILSVIIYPSLTGDSKLASHPTIFSKSCSVKPSSMISSLFTPAINGLPLNKPALTSMSGAIEIAPIVLFSNLRINSITSSFSIASLISIAPGKIKLSYSSIFISEIVWLGKTINPSSLLTASFVCANITTFFSAKASISRATLNSKLQKEL